MKGDEQKLPHFKAVNAIQVTEVGNSVRMELEGLKRGLEFLLRNSCSIERIVTDRHSSIRAFLRREYPSVLHLFDCWHMAKGELNKALQEVVAACPQTMNVCLALLVFQASKRSCLLHRSAEAWKFWPVG